MNKYKIQFEANGAKSKLKRVMCEPANIHRVHRRTSLHFSFLGGAHLTVYGIGI